MKKPPPYPFNHRHAVRHLKKADARMRRLIERAGPFRMRRDVYRTPYESLFRSILYQQLNGKAAEAIFTRVRERVGGGEIPSPEQFLVATDSELRAAGLSRQKIAALRDLAEKTAAGVVPSFEDMEGMESAEIVARLTAVRGVGVWTAEMLLMFRLGRPDVLPVLDFGVRNGFALAYRRKEMPKPKELAAFGERWRPYRSVASWYLWRAVDLHNRRKAEEKSRQKTKAPKRPETLAKSPTAHAKRKSRTKPAGKQKKTE
jgi:3-methyladenine DNA glycosylase/8-oxoguanine DNA glycosylase